MTIITSGSDSPWERQEGGTHYKTYTIQPLQFAMSNNLNFCQANAVKYICRYKDKGGVEDLRKAIHYIDLLIDYEYGNGTDNQTA
jgi:hypothetical protein